MRNVFGALLTVLSGADSFNNYAANGPTVVVNRYPSMLGLYVRSDEH